MSISDKDGARRQAVKTAFAYGLVSLFCALFGAVYEAFSHGVYSDYMLYAFAFPLAGGALPFMGKALFGRQFPGRLSGNLYHCGIAALTVGSVMRGVLEIYGTTNALVNVYWIAGAVFAAASLAAYAAGSRTQG